MLYSILKSNVMVRLAFDLISRISYPNTQFVTVVHHSAPSRRNLTALAATRDIENVKAAKYSSVALERGARFMAFIVESYGALGKQAMELLKLLDNVLDRAPARPFELSGRAVMEALAVALQRGNAFVSHSGSLTARAQAVSV